MSYHGDESEGRPTLERISMELGNAGGDLNLKQLYYFHAVATEGTIARASKRVRVAQATISEQIKNLEEYLGMTLLERRTTGVRLNQEGRRLLEHTTSLFRNINRMLHDLSPGRTSDRWVLEVGVCPSISRTFALKRFLPLFELDSIALRIRNGRYEELMEDLLAGEIDLLLTENPPTVQEDQKVGKSLLQSSPLIFVAGPKLAPHVEQFPHDLADLPYIAFAHGSRYRWDVENFLVSRGVSPRAVAEVDDVGLMASACMANLAFAAVPKQVVEGELERGDLVELGAVEGSQSSVYALYQSTKTPEVVMQAVRALGGELSA